MSKSIDGVLDNDIKGDVFANKDEALEANLNAPAKTEEPIDLTRDDTDDEFEGHYTNKLRPNKRLRLRKLRHKIMRRASQASNQMNRMNTESALDDSSVMSRFSVNESDQEKESSAKPPATKRAKKKKTSRKKKEPTRAKKTAAKHRTSTSNKPSGKKKKDLLAKSSQLGIIAFHQEFEFPKVIEELTDVYYLTRFYPKPKLLVKKRQQSPRLKDTPIERFIEDDGMNYELICSKFIDKGGKQQGKSYPDERGTSQKYYKSYYLQVSDKNGAKTCCVADELQRIADFRTVAEDEGPEKAIARLQLLVSPACKMSSAKIEIVHELETSTCNVIKDKGNDGCGFISRELLTASLGDCKRAKDSTAIQVRLFSPTKFGVAKGMLMVKDNIDGIEIPTSMIKVKKSTENPLHDSVIMIVTNIFPRNASKVTSKGLGGLSGEHQVSEIKTCPPATMFRDVMLAAGVSNEALSEYIKSFKTTGIKHACLIGVADPTDCIPSGHIFITGLKEDQRPKEAFLTRSPCTEAGDGKVVPVCDDSGFFSDDWDFLSCLPFGTVVFPRDERSLPSTINSGDLDGDNYFVIWDEAIVSQAANESSGCRDSSVSKCFDEDLTLDEDELIGATLNYKGCNAEIVRKVDTGYLAVLKGNEVTLTKDEISAFIHIRRVIGHSIKGRDTIFRIEWNGGIEESVSGTSLRRKFATPPVILINYAYYNKLAVEREDCKWLEEHFGEAALVRIVGHRGVGDDIEVQCEYDDDEQPVWELLDGHLIGSKLHVGKYAREHGLLDTDGWEHARNLWFREIQECLLSKRFYEVNRLVGKTCKFWKKVRENPHSEAALIWGRAYKQALELEKHADKMKLPLEYYRKVATGEIGKTRGFKSLVEPIYCPAELVLSKKVNSSTGYAAADNVNENPNSDSGWGTRVVSSDDNNVRDSNSGWGRQSGDESAQYSATKTSTINLASDSGRSSGMSPVNTAAVTTAGWSRPASTKANPVTPTNASNSGWGRTAAGGDMNQDSTCDSGWGRSPGHSSAGVRATSSQGWNNNGMDKESDLGWDRSTAVGSKSQDSNNDSGWGRPPANLSAGVDATNNCVNVNEKAGDSGWGRAVAAGSKNQDSNADLGLSRSPANLSAGVGATGSQGWDNTGVNVNEEAGDSGWGRYTTAGSAN